MKKDERFRALDNQLYFLDRHTETRLTNLETQVNALGDIHRCRADCDGDADCPNAEAARARGAQRRREITPREKLRKLSYHELWIKIEELERGTCDRCRKRL